MDMGSGLLGTVRALWTRSRFGDVLARHVVFSDR